MTKIPYSKSAPSLIRSILSRFHHYLNQQLISTKRMRLHATMACYTFFESSWHAKCQSMSKMDDPAYGGHAIGKRPLNLIFHLLRRSPIGRVNGRTLVRY